MKQFNVIISPSAMRDMSGIYEYISTELSAKDSADKIMKTFKHVIDNIGSFPAMYPLHRDEKLSVNGVRIAPVKNYSVLYIYYNENVYVVRVVYGKVSMEDLYMPYPQDLSIVCEGSRSYNGKE